MLNGIRVVAWVGLFGGYGILRIDGVRRESAFGRWRIVDDLNRKHIGLAGEPERRGARGGSLCASADHGDAAARRRERWVVAAARRGRWGNRRWRRWRR